MHQQEIEATAREIAGFGHYVMRNAYYARPGIMAAVDEMGITDALVSNELAARLADSTREFLQYIQVHGRLPEPDKVCA